MILGWFFCQALSSAVSWPQFWLQVFHNFSQLEERRSSRPGPHDFPEYTGLVPAGVGELCWSQLLRAGTESQLLQCLHVVQIKAL